MEFDVHLVETHMRKMDLMVVYTNDLVIVESSINTMEWLLAEYGKYRAVSFDLAYTNGRAGHDQKVVIAELCMHQHILISTSAWPQCLASISSVEAIINPYYGGMNAECEKNKVVWHMAWIKRFDEHHLQTVSKEVYTCYEMFRRIVDMRNCLLPEYVEGSRHKHSGGGKRHRK
ncbi:hypothetical protein D1007_34042 [Hordeum vulgare]|nr:hypothetical protein D1007_34042 [Hordeum vulgare]